MRLKVAIIGASGYTGLELLRILAQHPDAEVVHITSRQYSGKRLDEVFPAFKGIWDIGFSDPSETLPSDIDIAFTALPHGSSMDIVPGLLDMGIKVIDLSADFRLKSVDTYRRYYGEHSSPDLLKNAVYGIPELSREEIKDSNLVANPGCYAIASILGIAPLASKGFIGKGDNVVIDAKSGVSGAGRTPAVETSFVEVNEGFRPYKVAEHRHCPEIEEVIGNISGGKPIITFVPHLLPTNRGILATIYTDKLRITEKDLQDLYVEFYVNEPFIRILDSGTFPNISHVRGSNLCDISVRLDTRTERAIIMVAIDNLVKGASGNAVQNMNVIFGLPEGRGLPNPLYP